MKLNLGTTLATTGAGLALAGLCLSSPAMAGAAPAASRVPALTTSLGIFLPYWQNVEPSPGGCSGPVTPGYHTSGTALCGTDSNGDGIVDYTYLTGGSSVSYTFTVPSGTTTHLTLDTPSAQDLGNGSTSIKGGYLNNSPAEISVDGHSAGSITKSMGNFGAECQTIARCIVWQSGALGAGTHTLTVKAANDYINFYGLWVLNN